MAAMLPAAMCLISCDKTPEKDIPGDPVPIVLTEKQKAVVDSASNFAFDIFCPLVKEAKGAENLMISPFSISSALTMTLNGAANETYSAILKTLRLDGKTLDEINDAYLKLMTDMVPVDERVVMKIANSVWPEKTFIVKEGFLQALKSYFKAEVKNFDITKPEESIEEINTWIEDNTNGKIKDMLNSMEPFQVMYLINAVYFNGKWKYQFDADKTSDKPFYLSSGSSKNVPTMYNETNLAITHSDDVTLVELPYGQGNYTMVVALPDDGVTPSDVAGGLNAKRWTKWMSSLENTVYEVHFSMPRFKYEYKRKLQDDLTALGMGIAFTGSADFSGITDDDISISEVFHQTFIETNEEGTEAAAATVVGFEAVSLDPSIITVEVNRPFLYFIREIYTGTIVFMGVVEDPTAE